MYSVHVGCVDRGAAFEVSLVIRDGHAARTLSLTSFEKSSLKSAHTKRVSTFTYRIVSGIDRASAFSGVGHSSYIQCSTYVFVVTTYRLHVLRSGTVVTGV